MNRRSLLLGAGLVTLAQLLPACGRLRQSSLRIRFLEDSISPQILREFRRQIERPAALDFGSEEQLAELFKLLQTWRYPPPQASGLSKYIPIRRNSSSSRADLVSLGDYWLATAIQKDLIQPMELSQLKGLANLSAPWRQLVRRDRAGRLAPEGKVFWGAPYRWGSLMMVYREQPFKSLDWRPMNWNDLLQKKELKQRISLPDHPRIVIGVALKSLGQSFNKPDLESVSELEETLVQLHKQVKFYSSDTYLQPLINEDTWLAIGWSTDILPAMKRYRQLKAVIPNEGTLLTADLWVQPKITDSDANKNETNNSSPPPRSESDSAVD